MLKFRRLLALSAAVHFSNPLLAAAQDVRVNTFTLLSADDGQVIQDGIVGSLTIDLDKMPSKSLALRANTFPSIVRKVDFSLNGQKTVTDSVPPYALFADDGGNFNSWSPKVGTHQVIARPYDRETSVAGADVGLQVVVLASGPSVGRVPEVPPVTPPPIVSNPPTLPPIVLAPTGPLPVFPGAHGFGTTTVAGSGRHLKTPSSTIYKVTSLADSGMGTLRACVDGKTPRVCVFETSGIITLTRDLQVRSPYLTIAGQTAPPPGILVRGASLRIMNHDVLVKHLQFRVGDSRSGPSPDQRDGISIGSSSTTVHGVVLDHISLSWAVDENLSTGFPGTRDVTVSNSIIAEALHNSIHSKGAHSMGFLVGDDTVRITSYRNVFAHNHDRNPRVKAGAQLEFVSNIVYGWGGSSPWNQVNLQDSTSSKKVTLLSFIGNYYKRSPDSPSGASINPRNLSQGARIYSLGNIGPTRALSSLVEWAISPTIRAPQRSSVIPFSPSGVEALSYDSMLNTVLPNSGSRPRESNPVDNRVLREVMTGKGGIKDCVTGCTRSAGGYPSMPVVSRVQNLPTNPFSDDNGNGYTNLEDWLNDQAVTLE